MKIFGYRAVLYIKEKTHCVYPFQVIRIYGQFVINCHCNKTKQYCTSINGKRIRRIVNKSKKTGSIRVNELVRPDFKNRQKHGMFTETNLCEEGTHRESECNDNTSNDINEKNNIMLHKDLHALYPHPVTTVHSFYDIVRNELHENSMLNIHYKECNNGSLTWKCTYDISWPKEAKITTYGVSKRAASRQAALRCLHWLHTQNRIRYGKPIIYIDKEIEHKRNECTPINLDFEILEEVKRFLNAYENHINDIIKWSQLNDNTSNFTSSSKDFIYGQSPSALHCTIRNEKLRNRLLENDVHKKCDLPVFKYRDEILQGIENNQIIVIKGSTGCGKTTQIPQFIMDSFIRKRNATDCNILISQPRRISAISLAERIAFERRETLGDSVGYSVRLEKTLPQFPGGMLFCTTGILRQLIQNNPNLTGYSHVILDEAHERTLDIDVLLVLLKRAIQNNSSLKLIIMSATINTDLFQKYYNCKCIDIPGKTYPVKTYFMEDFQDILSTSRKEQNINYNDDEPSINCYDIANLIRWIIKNKPPGGILCFLPGWSEITKVNELLCNDDSLSNKALVLPLHSKLSNISQRKIFDQTPSNISKVILATDIAETGITVPNITYVVDSAIKNSFLWDELNFSLYKQSQKVSQANIQQRKGRAGRVQPGESYHFIRKEEYERLDPFAMPEILRCALERTVIEIKTYTNEKVTKFCESMLQPPSTRALHKAVNTLRQLNIIDINENLTPLGKLVAHFPLHPTLGKALVLSTIFQCFQPLLYITAIYSADTGIFTDMLNNNLKKNIKKLYHKTSDHLAMAMLYEEWKKKYDVSDFKADMFCDTVNISPSKMKLTSKLCDIFIKYSMECNLLEQSYQLNDAEMPRCDPNRYAFVEEMIHGIILSSTNKLLRHNKFSYSKGVLRKKSQYLTEGKEGALISTESVNYGKKFLHSPYLTYLNGIKLHSRSIVNITDSSIISPLTILFFSQGRVYYQGDNNDNCGNIIVEIGTENKVLFSCDAEQAQALISFRNVIWSMADYFIREKYHNVNSINESDCINAYKSKALNILSKLLSTSITNEK